MTKRAAGLKALGLGESASNAWRSSEFGDSIIQDFATTSGAAELIALGLKESDVKASRLSEIDHFNIQELDWVELEFKNMEGKMDFRAAFNALKDWHGSLVEAETHSPERRAFVEPVSLTRKINWDEGKVSKEKDVVPPAKQTSAKPALTSLHGAKAGQVNYSAPRSQTQRSLAGDPTNFPEMVAIAQSVAASPDSKFRPQPGLVGNPIIHPVRTGDMLPPVTAPLDSKTRRQQGLVGESTYHPDEKAGRLLLVAGSSNFDSKSHGRSRSYDVLDADQQTSSKTSYESSVGEMKRLRSTRIAHTGGQGRTPRIHSPSYAAHIANRKSKRVSWLLDEPLEAFAKAKQIQRQRRICRKLVLSVLWKWELNDGVPKEMWSSPASFEFINVLEVSRFDKIKNLFEAYSGREWDWWPLDPPAKPLESGNVRIRWQCVSEQNPVVSYASANGLRLVAINAGPIYRNTLPRSAKPSSMRIQQPGTKVGMPHLSQRAPPLITHNSGVSSQGRSPAIPRNQPELPLIYVPPHKLPIFRKLTRALIQKNCTFYSASTKEARSSTLKSSPPNVRTMKLSSKISEKSTAGSGASFVSGSHHCNSLIVIS